MEDNTINQGRNVKRLRKIFGWNQETLAEKLGDDWNQQKVSLLEDKGEIDPDVLDLIAKAMNVEPETIKNFDANAAINIVSNTFNDESTAYAHHYKCTFNPIDKVVELYEKSAKEKDETIAQLRKEIARLTKKK